MSDVGLYGSMYGQLRNYADQIDKMIVDLKNPDAGVASAASKKMAGLLREILDVNTLNPKALLVQNVLERELPEFNNAGSALAILTALEQYKIGEYEMATVEKIAMTLDNKCADALARLRGRA